MAARGLAGLRQTSFSLAILVILAVFVDASFPNPAAPATSAAEVTPGAVAPPEAPLALPSQIPEDADGDYESLWEVMQVFQVCAWAQSVIKQPPLRPERCCLEQARAALLPRPGALPKAASALAEAASARCGRAGSRLASQCYKG